MNKFKSTKLKETADVYVGYQAKTRIHEDANGSHFLVQGRDIDQSLHLKDKIFIRFNPEIKIENYLLNKGDILFQARGADNYACLIHKKIPNTIAAGSFYIIRTNKPEIHPAYLAWWLNLPHVQKSFQSIRSGTLISYVSIKALSEIEIPIPHYSIQTKIARVFELWKKEENLVKIIQDSRKALIQAACQKSVKKSTKENIDTSKGGQQ
ncbi:MAG: restriction endonuclease subunit S [Syntrophaceae bacterium]|nr:restriction endonuclease subunit S [Syntrophaceae bacterium]